MTNDQLNAIENNADEYLYKTVIFLTRSATTFTRTNLTFSLYSTVNDFIKFTRDV